MGDVELNELAAYHTAYCELLCDSMAVWYVGNYVDLMYADTVFNMIVTGMSSDLGASVENIEAFYDGLWKEHIELEDSPFYLALSSEEQDSVDALCQTVYDNWDLSDAAFMDLILAKLDNWENAFDPDVVDACEEIAKSSYPYWRSNWEGCITNGQPQGRNRKREGGMLATADVTGALFGSFGGPAGALLGGVGGTLGMAIHIAIYHD